MNGRTGLDGDWANGHLNSVDGTGEQMNGTGHERVNGRTDERENGLKGGMRNVVCDEVML